VSEIATALHREAVTIQQNYVSRMVDAGELEARYPDTPNHPAQAYRARGNPTPTEDTPEVEPTPEPITGA
jgi:hypothetical protein